MKTPKQKRLSKPEKSKCLKNVISLFPLPYPPPSTVTSPPGESPNFIFHTTHTISHCPGEFIHSSRLLGGGGGGTQCAICHDKFIRHPLRAASQAISVMKLSALNTRWWQTIPPLPPSLCASHYSLFSLSGDTSRPFASLALQETRTNGRLFPALHVVALITHGFCPLFSFL